MFDRLQDFFYSEPRRITGLGRLLTQLGVFLLLVGAMGCFVTGAINILPTLAKQPETTKTLADIYPTLPLWWVSESWLGIAVSAVLVGGGICIALHDKNVDRMLKTF